MFELLDTATAAVSAIEAEVLTSDGVKTVHAPPEAPEGFWSLSLDAPPGPLKVRVTAKNAAGEVVDGWSRDVTVPGGADRLGTPVVYRPASVAQFRALMAGSPVPPSARRRFRRTDRAIVRLPGAPDSGVRAELLNRQGAVLRLLAPSPAPAPRGVQFELPLGGLAQADYVLRFTAPGPGGAAARLLAFTVAP
jgi:hypothetical protein